MTLDELMAEENQREAARRARKKAKRKTREEQFLAYLDRKADNIARNGNPARAESYRIYWGSPRFGHNR